MKLDILALAAHPDDVELSCGGTICLSVQQGYKVGIVDFTRGELGSRGTPEIRDAESRAASEIMGIHARENLGISDGNIENSLVNQRKVITAIRRYQPHIMLINAPQDRHPDHPNAAQLALSSIFYAGLRMIETHETDGTLQAPWRPSHVLHYMQSDFFEPTLVVNVTTVWQQRMKCMMAFKSQFWTPEQAEQAALTHDSANDSAQEPQTFISTPAFLEWVESRAKTFGFRIGAQYAEPFLYANMPFGVTDLGKFLHLEKVY